MTGEARTDFHRDLERLDIAVGGLFGLIPEAVAAATTALLRPDPAGTEAVERWRNLVDDLYGDVEATIEVVVARQSPVAGDLRFLLACVRIVPALQEVVDLVAEVAAPGRRHIGPELTPRVTTLIEEVGRMTAALWSTVEEIWATRQADVAGSLRRQLDHLDDLRATLGAELSSGVLGLPVALELAVVSRTYERLAHHAQAVSARLAPLVGTQPLV